MHQRSAKPQVKILIRFFIYMTACVLLKILKYHQLIIRYMQQQQCTEQSNSYQLIVTLAVGTMTQQQVRGTSSKIGVAVTASPNRSWGMWMHPPIMAWLAVVDSRGNQRNNHRNIQATNKIRVTISGQFYGFFLLRGWWGSTTRMASKLWKQRRGQVVQSQAAHRNRMESQWDWRSQDGNRRMKCKQSHEGKARIH